MIGGHRDKQMDLLDVAKKSGRGRRSCRDEVVNYLILGFT